MNGPFTLAEAAAKLQTTERSLSGFLSRNPFDPNGQQYFCRLGRTVLFRESDLHRLETSLRVIARRPTFVYFIQVEGFIKIGRADNWKKRLSSIQTSCPFEARVLLVLKASDGREKELHRLFAAHHVRGEWYRDHEDIRSFLNLHDWQCRARGLTDKRGVSPPKMTRQALAGLQERIRMRRAMEITGLTERALQGLAARGDIPGAAKLGKCWTFNVAELRNWVRARESEPCRVKVAEDPRTKQATRSCAARSGGRALPSAAKSTGEVYQRAKKRLQDFVRANGAIAR